jgi:hypothetical protein
MSAGKKSWFAKPGWKSEKAKENSTSPRQVSEVKAQTNDDVADMFSRSGDTYAQIVAEQKEKEKRKKEKEEMKSKKRESGRMREEHVLNVESLETEEATEQSAKRIRISSESVDMEPSIVVPSSPVTPPEMESTTNATQSIEPIVIDLDDYTAPNPGVLESPPVISTIVQDEVMEGEDPELSELTRQARERAKQREENGDDEADPEIQVFIQPRIPNTVPLLITRRYRQNFRRIISAWCEENKLDKALAAEVIFTWQDKRVFNVSTFASLGIKLDMEGLPILISKDGYSEPMGKLALVATTMRIQQEDKMKRAEEESAKAEEVEVELPEKPKERNIRIVLRSKAYAEHKLIVKPVSI